MTEKPHHKDQSQPTAWHERFERYLDTEQRRAYFYGGIFVAFVLTIVIAAAVFALVDAPPV